MAYLVTGGAGFIGSHIAQHLLARGARVVVLDNFNSYYDPALKEHNIKRIDPYGDLAVVRGDVRDVELVERLLVEHRITHIAHLASMAGVRSSVTGPRVYVDVNTVGTVNLLEAARKQGLQQFILASTSSVYGATTVLPFVETDTADRPLSVYAASKRAAELLAHTYYNLYGLNITVLRFFNVYGPAGRPDMMPLRLMNAALDGTVIPLFDEGRLRRDWTYIDDTVAGVLTALERPLGYEVINLGCGSPLPMHDFIELIEEYTGGRIHTTPAPAPASEPPITYCDNTRARKLLGFAPQIALREGLHRTWEWFREYRGV